MLNTNNYKKIKIDNSNDFNVNHNIPEIKIIRNKYKEKGGVIKKKNKSSDNIYDNNSINYNKEFTNQRTQLEDNYNNYNNDETEFSNNQTDLKNNKTDLANDDTDLMNDETDLMNDDTDLINIENNSTNNNNESNINSKIDLNEIDQSDFLNQISIGDEVKIIYNSGKNTISGFITFFDLNSIEISNKSGIIEKFFIKNNSIINAKQLYIINKTDYPGYIDFMNIKPNSQVKITSKNEKYNQKIGIIETLEGNNVKIIFNDNTESLSYDLVFGLSKDYEIQRLEMVPNLEYQSDILDQINFIEDSKIKLTEQRNISEDDYIISNLEANELLTNQLIELLYRDNIYDKYKSVKQIVINLSQTLDKISKLYQLNDLERLKIENKILPNLFNCNFKNSNIIPLTSIKHIVYDKINEEISYRDHVIIKNDNFYKNELINISETSNKLLKKNYDYISYNHYINKLNELFLPSEIDTELNPGYEFNLDDSIDVFSTQPGKVNFLANRFLGKDYITTDQLIEPDSIDTVSNTYTQNYWMSEKHFKLNKIYDGNKLNTYAFIIIPNSNPNFDISTNKVNLIDIRGKDYKPLGEYISKVKKKSILINLNDTNKINYKNYRKKIIQINFKKFNNFTLKNYYDTINQISPSIIDLISKKHYKNIKSFEDINKYLTYWNINIEEQNYDSVKPFIKIIEENLLNPNKLNNSLLVEKYTLESKELVKNESNKLNSECLISNELLNSDKFKEIYGEYPYFKSKIDSQVTRFDWLMNSYDNGIYFLLNLENNSDNSQEIHNRNLEIINKLSSNIESSIIELNNINENNCKYLFISYIFISKSELNNNTQNILNKFCILSEPDNNLIIYQGLKKDNYYFWVQSDEDLLNDIEFVYFDNILHNDDKYKYIIKEINDKISRNNCNNKFFNNLNLIDSKRNIDLEKKINSIKYKLIEYEIAIDYLTNKNQEIINRKLFFENINVKILNLLNEKKYNSENVNEQNNLNKYKSSKSKLKKEFDKLTSDLDIESRNEKIYSFINNKLRKANPNEDPDFFYNPDSDEKIAAYDWLLETLITKEPEKSDYFSKELVYKYSQIVDGYYRSIIDGRQLFPVEYDDFAGYEDENGQVNLHREIVYVEDNYDEINNIDKELKKIENSVETYKIDKIVFILVNYLLETKNNPSPLEKKDKLFLYKTLLADIDNNLISIKQKVLSQFKKRFNREFNNHNIQDKNNINKLKESYIDNYLVIKSLALLIIVIQSSIPQYSIKVNRIKNCEYSLNGYPFDDLKYSEPSLLKYITCVLSYISNLDLNSNLVTNILKRYKDEDLYDKIYERFKLWYHNNSEIKIKYQDFLNNRELTDTSFIDNKIPLGFKPNPAFYNNFNLDSNLLLKEIDIQINNDKQNSSFINKYSNNCCLNNIKDNYYYFFKNSQKSENFDKIYQKATLSSFDYLQKNNLVKFDYYLSKSDIQNRINIYQNNIYPDYFGQDLAIKLFSKFTLDGNKRVIDFNTKTCLITGEKSELFLFTFYHDPSLIKDYEGKKAYSKFKNDLENRIRDRRDIVEKEKLKIMENTEIMNYLSIINNKNTIELDMDKEIYNDNKIHTLENIYKNINHYFESDIIKKLINEMKILKQDILNLNKKQMKLIKDNYNNIFLNEIEKSIKIIQKNIIDRIKNNLEFDDNNIDISDFIELDKNAYNLFKDNRKIVYNQYFNLLIVNLSKFLQNKRNNINIPKDWQASPDNILILDKNINKNNQIYELRQQNNDYNENLHELISILLTNLSSTYRYMNLLSYVNEETEYYTSNNSDIQLNINDYFEIYKFIFYISINEILKQRPSKDYNNFSINFFVIIFIQIKDLINKFNKTSIEVQNEVISQTENERQIHIKRVNDLRDENRKIDNELKKYKLGDFYGLTGKEDWERGLSVDKQYTDIANNDNLFYIPSKIDKGSELLDIQNAYYQDENDDN